MDNTRWLRPLYSSVTLWAAGCAKAARGAGAVDRSSGDGAPKSLVPAGPWPQNDERGMANTIGNGTWMRCSYYLAQPGAKSYELSARALQHDADVAVRPAAHIRVSPSVSLPVHQARIQRRDG